MGPNNKSEVFGGRDDREVGPFKYVLFDRLRYLFEPFWGWVDSQRDEAAFFDLEVEPRDVFEEVKIGLKGAEVVKRLD